MLDRFRLAPAALAFLALAAIIAKPLAASEITVNAIASEKMGAAPAIMVRTLDDNTENLRIQDQIVRTLKFSGYRVVEGAQLVLSFEPRQTEGAFSTTKRTIIELQGRNATGDDDQTKATMSIFNSQTGGVLNRGEAEGTRTVTPPEYRLDFFLDDQTNGRRVWQGWARADLGLRDSRAIAEAMVPVLLQNLGKTVKNAAFELP